MRRYLSGDSRDGLSFEKEKLSTKHLKSYSIRATGHNSATKSQTNTGHELQSDVPKSMGGGDAAPQPVEHLLAALIGCTQATAMFVGRSMSPRLMIDKLEFDIEAYRDNRGAHQQPIDKVPVIPSRLQAVSGTVKVFLGNGRALSRDDLDLLAWQTEVRCPVANMMIASGCKMDIQWIDGSASI
eukprot:CAMPEP_0196806498 /NCGR_PEP_ID=MMETSP1362-20130617/6405_1 /TAXON_ID=163516 /ORGANISM="Leptocylindrus danicus, Strain CCMP1856" /LENGTH=183 /DNA_ID=CAMNT_0042179999 /DNA_START=335 /DNA_END=886 /DNA_ORIENTATION=+